MGRFSDTQRKQKEDRAYVKDVHFTASETLIAHLLHVRGHFPRFAILVYVCGLAWEQEISTDSEK